MQGAEIELKFPISDVGGFRRSAEAAGFELRTERTFEHNTLYDTEDRSLRARGQILRLRTYGPLCTLTHKRQPPGNDLAARYKTRIETESQIDDCAAMAEIFLQLGYGPVFHYDKFRTEWSAAGAGQLLLDETPIGVWAELEGDPEWIDAMLERLGVPADVSTTASYGRLFLDWKERTGSPAEHMTFAETEALAAR